MLKNSKQKFSKFTYLSVDFQPFTIREGDPVSFPAIVEDISSNGNKTSDQEALSVDVRLGKKLVHYFICFVFYMDLIILRIKEYRLPFHFLSFNFHTEEKSKLYNFSLEEHDLRRRD